MIERLKRALGIKKEEIKKKGVKTIEGVHKV